MKLKQDSFFLLIIYKAKQDIKVNLIGADYDYKKLGIEDDKQTSHNPKFLIDL